MVRWLKVYTGASTQIDPNSEKLELIDLKKEMKKLKKKYGACIDKEEMIDSGSEHEIEHEDEKKHNETKEPVVIRKGPRTSVSAEVYGNFNEKKHFVPKVIHKSQEQINRIHNQVLSSFIFNNLDERELKTVVDAMEEKAATEGEYIIKQGEPGAVLFIIEKGHYDCFKQFVRKVNLFQ